MGEKKKVERPEMLKKVDSIEISKHTGVGICPEVNF